jgi:glycosyltransferase involved in cell wall biosynthesis
VTLGILYHTRFWKNADGTLWEAEGSLARYVDSLAPYFDEVVLCVPVHAQPQALGSRITAANVTLAPLPDFPGPRQFYPMLPAILARLREWVDRCDVINLRVPSPAAYFAFRIAKARRKPVFLLVVGDLQALLPHLGYRGIKHFIFKQYVAFEERAIALMTKTALTFTNGAALREKHQGAGRRIYETRTTTIHAEDIATRTDALSGSRVRLLAVSRIDPRKGLRAIPEAVAALRKAGHDATIDIIGPALGQNGEREREVIEQEAARLGIAGEVRFRGPMALGALIAAYRNYDVFVLPTKPGEGIPRVLLEAMANGLPVVTTAVAGIASLITHEQNGLLMSSGSPAAIVAAVERLIGDAALRQRLIANGYETARAHTSIRQAAQMMQIVGTELALTLRDRSAA